jgi:YD repeat-containing protein
LAIVDRDGHLVRFLEPDGLSGGPTWTGDGRIVVTRDPEGDDTTTLWVISADGEDEAQVTDGVDGSDSHPDWSDHGLLFLRERDGSKDVFYLESLEARDVRPLTVSGKAASPAWGPNSRSTVVWLEPAAATHERTLYVKRLGDAAPAELGSR